MFTSLEQSISYLLEHGKPRTVAKVMAVYLYFIGYTDSPDSKDITVPHEAAVAFEHALDKQPAWPAYKDSAEGFYYRRGQLSTEIAAIRKEYWVNRLGTEEPSRCTCPKCGATTKYAVSRVEELEQEERRVQGKMTRRKKGRGKKTRVAKRSSTQTTARSPATRDVDSGETSSASTSLA